MEQKSLAKCRAIDFIAIFYLSADGVTFCLDIKSNQKNKGRFIILVSDQDALGHRLCRLHFRRSRKTNASQSGDWEDYPYILSLRDLRLKYSDFIESGYDSLFDMLAERMSNSEDW